MGGPRIIPFTPLLQMREPRPGGGQRLARSALWGPVVLAQPPAPGTLPAASGCFIAV